MAKQISIAAIVVLCLCLTTLTPQPAQAQAVYGGIIGTVTDPQGAAVANAKVTVLDEGKGTSDTTTTNESGNYSVGHLIAGTYTVRAEAPGFKISQQKGVIVNVDANASVPLQFQVGGTSETVEVTGEAPQLKTDRSDVAMTFDFKYVEDLPIFNRNFTSLQLAAPGSQKLVGWSHAATENPQGGQQIFSQGQHFSGTGFELDGTDNQDPILGIIVINPNLEAVTEAKIALQNYDAEFGKAVASLVTAVTKSGSNTLHGGGFYFLRSDGFQARDPFTQSTPNSVTHRFIPQAKWQQFGGTIGGAIVKDKLFFFGDYQGTRQTSGISTQFSIPTALAQSTCNPATNTTGFCDLSDYIDFGGAAGAGKGQIFDPSTGTLVGKGGSRLPFGPGVVDGTVVCTNNCIPIGMISPQAAAILAKFPAPQNAGLTNNLVGSGSGPFSQNSFDTRIDYNASQSVSVFGRYSLSHYTLAGKGILGALGGSGTGPLGLSGSSIIHNYSLAAGFTKTISPTLLTDFRFGYFKYNPVASKPDGGQPMNDFGIGVDGNLANTSDPKTAGLGAFLMDNVLTSFGDGLGVGRCNCPLTESEQQFQFVNNWTKVHGNHQYKVGADIRYAMNLRLPSDNNRTGEYTFNHLATSSGDGNGGTIASGFGGLDLATFLLGDVTQLQRYANNPASGGSPAERQKRWFFYGQDTWRATSKLTVNYGLRWEIYFPESVNAKGAGGFANIVDNGGLGAIRVAGYGGIGSNGNIKNDYKALAPRLGIAYRITPKTVVRMGYGRSYDIGVFGSNFGHTVTQNLPVLLKQNLKATNLPSLPGSSDDYIPIFTLADGPIAPDFGGAIPSNGLIPLNSSLSGTHIRPVRQTLPAVDAWNVTVQRQVTSTVSAEVAYVGSKGTHGFAGNGPNYDINPPSMANFGAINPITGKVFTQNERRPLCGPEITVATPTQNVGDCSKIGFDLGNYYGNDAASNYNAFEVKVDKRFAKGLQFLAHYTFSHANNYDSNYYAIDHRIAWGPVDFNRNHVFIINTVYELPFGKGKMYMGDVSRGLDYLVGGWLITNTTNWSSGLPWTPSFSQCNSEQDVGVCRPNSGTGSFRTGVGNLDVVNHSIPFFTPISDITTTSGQAFTDPGFGHLGNIGRNSFHGPAGFYSDLSVSKNFAISERFKARFIFDAFNVFNHPVYDFSANSGGHTCIDCANAKASDNNGKITGLENGTSMRGLQFALKFDF